MSAHADVGLNMGVGHGGGGGGGQHTQVRVQSLGSGMDSENGVSVSGMSHGLQKTLLGLDMM